MNFLLFFAVGTYSQQVATTSNVYVPFLTGNQWKYDDFLFNYRGGSITAGLADVLSQFGFPSRIITEIRAITDDELIDAINSWPASTRNRLSNDFYMTANFYRNTFFNQLITTTAAEGVETYVATLVFAYENQGNSVEDLMSTVVENNYDNLVAQAATFNETTRSTDSIAILNIFDAALSDYSAIGLSRSLQNNIFFFTNFLYAYEQLLDSINFAIFAYRSTQEIFLNAYDLAAYCSENEGPFTYLNKWVAAFDAIYRLIYRFFEIDLEFNILFVGGLFGGEQDEIPLLYEALPWLNQFKIASILSVIDNQISLAALLIDPIIQTPLYNLLRFPVCDRF